MNTTTNTRGVSEAMVERTLLASYLDDGGWHTEANNVREGVDLESYENELSLIGWLLRNAALSAPEPAAQGEGFGLSDGDIAALRDAGLKPDEIAGDAAKQHERVSELVHWLARFLRGHANPKWLRSHAMELAYYIATNAGNRHIDVDAIRQAGFKEGLNVTPAERAMLERIGVANPAPPAQPAERVPEGMVLVPREPTEEMLVAGLKEADPIGELIDWKAGVSAVADPATRDDLSAIYAAMLTASPAPSEGGKGVEG